MKITFKHELKLEDNLTNEQIVALLLKSRQIKDIDEFLNPTSPLEISLKDFGSYEKPFKKVVKLLKEIKEKNKMIVVYTDYDADGITGGAVLWETLHLLGFQVMPYVPDRRREGYGFSTLGIDNVKKQFNPALIISVDHGITKVKEIAYAKKLGIKIIVTDHHLKGDKIPKDAEAIFHITALSGSGVAYFFAKEIFNNFKSKNSKLLENNFLTDYLALASIGTIADLVPLSGSSRSVVKFGLNAFAKVKRPGIRHILKQAGIEDKRITPYEVGFIIAPRINAVGRLESAIDALRLLCTTNEKKAFELARKVGATNIERQVIVTKSVEEAKTMLPKKLPKVIILVSDHWNEGVIGLIASKIAEEFYRPTLVLTKTDDHYKGSARSIPSFHVTEFLRSLKKYLIDVGGHKQAAGFTLEKKQLDDFSKNAYKLADKLIKDKDLERKIEADLKIPLEKIDISLVESLETLEPFGMGNPRPVFLSQGEIVNVTLFGKTNKHLKIFVKDKDSLALELIAFNQSDQFTKLSRGKKIEVVYSLEIDRWGGREKLRGKVISIFKF
jgi:single-stranded-DNA-specific exonuclease